VEFLLGISDNPVIILLMINVMLLMHGMILLINLGLGLCTPPVSWELFPGEDKTFKEMVIWS